MTRVGRRPVFAVALALGALCAVPSFVRAAPGDLDTSFGGDGTVLAQFDQEAGANAVAAQPDGSIVAAGTYSEAQFAQFAVARWLADGTPDPGFSDDGDGQFHRQFAAGPGPANGVALQSDGAIVAAGGILDQQEGDGEVALLRLTAAGVPDATFGSDGEVTTEFAGGDAEADAVTVLPDGTIVAVGELDTGAGSEFAIARYGVDGTLLWQTTTQFADGAARAADVVIEPDRIIAIGTVVTPSGSARFALAGYTLAGDLDPTFGNGGTQDTAFVGGGAVGRGAVLANTGQILVAGDFTAAIGNARFALARYTADGQLDITFQTEGRTTTPFSQANAFGADVVQEPCGGLVVGGLAFEFSFGHQAFALAGYGADGTLNPGFGTGGTQTTRFATDEGSGTAVTLAPGDKPVIAGPITSRGDIQFGVARYEGSCVTPPPPPPSPPPSPPPPPPPPPPLPRPPERTALATIKTTAALLRTDRTVRIVLRCRTVRLPRCRGVLGLTERPRSTPSRGRKRSTFVSLGRARYSIAKGRRVTVILRVSRGAQRALGRRRRVAARGTARTRQPSGATRTAARGINVLVAAVPRLRAAGIDPADLAERSGHTVETATKH
jgi:uncharacterized delta-60 repeat protein